MYSTPRFVEHRRANTSRKSKSNNLNEDRELDWILTHILLCTCITHRLDPHACPTAGNNTVSLCPKYMDISVGIERYLATVAM